VTTETHDLGKRGRNGGGEFTRTLAGAERDTEAARLQARGLPLRKIAEQLGYANESGASKAISRALAAVPVQGVDELRRIQCDQLDYLTAKALEVLEAVHYAHSQSGNLILGPGGEYLHDDAPVLNAIDRVLKIAERRAKLMGLDAPQRHEVTTLDYLDAQIRDAAAELARAQAAEAAQTQGA
jgi:hypothetical protein